jgi:hypothetical protein
MICCVGSVVAAQLIVAQLEGFESPRHPAPMVKLVDTTDLESVAQKAWEFESL